jgi:hypothetical protein
MLKCVSICASLVSCYGALHSLSDELKFEAIMVMHYKGE